MRPGPFSLVLVLAAGAAGGAAAQTPEDTAAADTTPPETTPAVAPYVAPRFAFSLTLGTVGFGDLHIQRVRVENLARDGSVLEDAGSLRRKMSASDGLQANAAAVLGLSPAWALRAGASVGRATLEAGYTGEQQLRDDVAAIRVAESPDLTILAIEGALRFRMRSGRPFHPYAEMGLAAVRMAAEDVAYPGAAAMDGATSLAGLAAVGAVVPVWDVFAGRIQLTGHFFRTPLRAATVGAPVVEGNRLRVTFDSPEVGNFADPMPELTRTLRLDVGVVIDLGARPPSHRAAAAVPTAGSLP